MMCPAVEVIDQMTSHGNLFFGLFRERYAHRVANAVGQQGAYSYGTFDTSILAFTRFRNAEM